jgi:uncharacterized protein YndB with AHSA1/START domain
MTTITETNLITQVYQVFIRATPEQIWDAITQSEFTTRYFYGSELESSFEPGARYVQWAPKRERIWVEGEILESEAPRRLAHTWRSLFDDESALEQPSRVTWEIEPQEGGVTKLTVVHDQLEASPKTAESVSGGWSYVLSGLKTLLETGEPLASN